MFRFVRAAAYAVALMSASACERVAEQPSAQPAGDPQIRLSSGPSGSGTVDVVGLSVQELAQLERAALTAEQWATLMRVQVVTDASPLPDRPAVLGAYAVTGGVVRFTPQFPFESGTRYDVDLDASRLTPADEGDPVPLRLPRLKTTVQLPVAERHATTRIVGVFPSAQALPENQLRIYIAFSAPMGLMSGTPHVQLLDKGGRAVLDPFLPLDVDLWNEDRTRYTLLFDPGRVKRGILPHEEMGRSLIAGRKYTLVVDAEWRDAAGQPLVTPFRREFRVGPPQERAIEPAEWRVDAPSGGTRDPLTVSFPWPLDYGLLHRALNVSFEHGDRVPGTIDLQRGETRWVFTPQAPWKAGLYRLVAASVLEDVAGNRIGKPFEVAFLQEPGAREARGATLSFRIRE